MTDRGFPDNSPYALEVRSISKHFPGSQALDAVSLGVRPGEIRALIGENGAGKSTLMNIVMGLVAPDSGVILRAGEEVAIDSPLAAQHLGIGMVPQELNLVPHLSVTENINLGALPSRWWNLGIDWAAARRRAEDILGRIGGHVDPRAMVADLSMAQRQLVQISRALVFNAQILIFDEPTASLTYNETERLFGLIRAFRAGGGSVFYISHRLEEIRELADTVTVLRDGRKVADLVAADADIKEMIRHMAGRDIESSARAGGGAMDQTVLKVENLSRDGEFTDVSFELRRGEILGFAGLVGAGRTELMRCICGDSLPDSGSVLYSEKPGRLEKVLFRHPAESIRAGIAYVPEERRNLGIVPQLDVMENMAMPSFGAFSRAGLTLNRAAIRKTSQGYVDEMGIKTSGLAQCIQNLSGGNQQKVIIARWLMKGCRILILDEPTRGIDVNAKSEIYRLLHALIREKDMSIVVVSSELQELLDVSDRIIVMHEGAVRAEVRPDAGATQEQILRHALDGEATTNVI